MLVSLVRLTKDVLVVKMVLLGVEIRSGTTSRSAEPRSPTISTSPCRIVSLQDIAQQCRNAVGLWRGILGVNIKEFSISRWWYYSTIAIVLAPSDLYATMAPPPQLEGVLVEQLSAGAVLLSYNRPKFANAFIPQQYDDLREALVWARKEPAVRTVVV